METIGGIAALSSAGCFALASVFFRRVGQNVSPLIITIVKSCIACLLSCVILWGIGQPEIWLDGFFPSDSPALDNTRAMTTSDIALLVCSGFLGITIGDTAYFATLNALGTRRTLLLDTLSPACTSILAVVFLGESLSLGEVQHKKS